MPLLKPRSASPARIAANRANALKSTGPRSAAGKRHAALNALKHGVFTLDTSLYARLVMVKTGEDPAAYDRLLEDLLAAWNPSNALESLLVRDLAQLYWRKVRAENLRAAIEAGAIMRREAPLHRPRPAYPEVSPAELDFDASLRGYRWANECPLKFERCHELLDKIESLVERRAWEEESAPTLESLYSQDPMGDGARIVLLIGRCGQPDAPIEADCAELKELLKREREKLQKEREIYERDYQADTQLAVYREQASMQADAERQQATEANLDRRIQEKIRLLLQLKGSPALGNRRRPAKRAKRDGESPRRATSGCSREPRV